LGGLHGGGCAVKMVVKKQVSSRAVVMSCAVGLSAVCV
jgi:hypothetical protein